MVRCMVFIVLAVLIDVFTVQVKFERILVRIPEGDYLTVGVVAMGDLSENLTVTVVTMDGTATGEFRLTYSLVHGLYTIELELVQR